MSGSTQNGGVHIVSLTKSDATTIANSLTDYRKFERFLRTPLVHSLHTSQTFLKRSQTFYNTTQTFYNLTRHIIRIRSYLTIHHIHGRSERDHASRATHLSIRGPSVRRRTGISRQQISIERTICHFSEHTKKPPLLYTTLVALQPVIS